MSDIMNMDLIYALFDAANMHRWNDHLRPIDLTEIDKQAHKAAIAWVLGKYEEQERNTKLNWRRIIEGCLFSFMKRTVLTDLKPQLLHRMEEERFDEVNDYVISEISRTMPDLDKDFLKRFENSIRSRESSVEDRIVAAAHYLATNWEFNLIYDMNRHSFAIDQTKATISMELSTFSDLAGVKMLIGSQSMTFVDLIGQLRFQQRWTRIPRIPATTVLGHSLMVATMMYLHDLEVNADDKQSYNDYYTGLFHDLPEVLTKDVISPVKVNVEGLAGLLDEYEHELIESKIMPLIPEGWRDELRFFVYDPFDVKDDIRFGKAAGKELKMCDILSAYIEVNVSRRYGVHSSKMREGEDSLRERLLKEGDCINAESLIERFDAMRI